jgi:hypothetical protein
MDMVLHQHAVVLEKMTQPKKALTDWDVWEHEIVADIQAGLHASLIDAAVEDFDLGLTSEL